MPSSTGRMLRVDIGKSQKFASLSPDSQRLFILIIPHLTAHGKINGEPETIKGICVPLIKDMTTQKIKKCLIEISQKTNMKWFKKDGLSYIHCVNWGEHQEIRKDRLGKDTLPDYSRTIPGVLQHEVEVEVEVEVEDKVEVEGEAPSHLFSLWNEMSARSNGVFKQLRAMSAARAVKCSARLKELPTEDWNKIMDKLLESSFLRGEVKDRDGRSWQASFDWLINNNENPLKVLEGNYDDKRNGASPVAGKYDHLSKVPQAGTV